MPMELPLLLLPRPLEAVFPWSLPYDARAVGSAIGEEIADIRWRVVSRGFCLCEWSIGCGLSYRSCEN